MPARSGLTGSRRWISRSTLILMRDGSMRTTFKRRGSSGRIKSALSSTGTEPGVAFPRSTASRSRRSSTPSRIVRGPRTVTMTGFVGWLVTMRPAASERTRIGMSNVPSASRSVTLIENQMKKASRSETTLSPGFRLSAAWTSRQRGTRSSRRQGGVGPGGSGAPAIGSIAGGVSRPRSTRSRIIRLPAASSDQEPLQRGAQRRRVDVARDLALAHERDHPVLLGDDDRHAVGLLRETDGGAVARPERLRDRRVRREREEAAGGRDPPVLNDERAVVDRRARDEDARHELLRDLRLEPGSDLDVLVQVDLVLEHDERADAPRSHVGDALHQLFDRLALRDAVLRGEERARADLRQRAADV